MTHRPRLAPPALSLLIMPMIMASGMQCATEAAAMEAAYCWMRSRSPAAAASLSACDQQGQELPKSKVLQPV